ncbi:MAG: hypothetical protein OXH36_05045 [Bdellovibrionales bacterium]|nr:hypothetical protein [Bdellovibrionales bacterium]
MILLWFTSNKRETAGKAGKKHGGLMFDFTGLFQFFTVLGLSFFQPSAPTTIALNYWKSKGPS